MTEVFPISYSHPLIKSANVPLAGSVTRYAVKELATIVQNGKRHFVRITATQPEAGEPLLHVWLWAKSVDISGQLTEEQRQQFLKELFPAGRS